MTAPAGFPFARELDDGECAREWMWVQDHILLMALTAADLRALGAGFPVDVAELCCRYTDVLRHQSEAHQVLAKSNVAQLLYGDWWEADTVAAAGLPGMLLPLAENQRDRHLTKLRPEQLMVLSARLMAPR